MISILRLLRTLLYVALAVLVFINIFILLSGKLYLYNGIAKTYLKGKTGPGIYDLDLFPVNTIQTQKGNFYWKEAHQSTELTQESMEYHNTMETRAFLIVKEDTILYEHYWNKHDQSTVSNSFSMAKTIVSLLVGVALQEGKIKTLDEPVSNYIDKFNYNARDALTIKQVLTMSAGFDWEESGINPLSETAEAYYGNHLERLVTTQKIVETPGKTFHYQSGNTQILAMILEKATGKTISEYAQEKLWKKIGSENEAFWSLDKEQGDEKAYCCFYATTRDFARLGRLLLEGGAWEGYQLISKEYIEEMFTPQTDLLTEEGIKNQVYSYQFWTYNNFENPMFYFRGLLGQYIMILPKEKTIIVRLGEKTEKNFKLHRAALFPNKTNTFDCLVGHSVDILKYLEMKEEITTHRNSMK